MKEAQEFESSIPYKLLWQELDFCVTNNVHTTTALNNVTSNTGSLKRLIEACDLHYEEQIQRAATTILANNKIRCIIIAGPSSSGKTTTTHKLAAILKFLAGISFRPLELDNYYFDIAIHPKDAHGDINFERPECIDLELINQHLQALLAGQEVKIPSYDFKTGHRTDNATPLRLKDNEILLLDSLHGLYPAMTAAVPAEQKFKLYLEPFSQLKNKAGEFMRWTDVRLLRRMSRDRLFRNYGPEQTLGHWHYVRQAELQYIFPYEPTVDFVINSSIPYELPFLKSIIWPFLPNIIEQFQHEEDRDDAVERIKRVYNFLAEIQENNHFELISREALLREFIGGSSVIEQ